MRRNRLPHDSWWVVAGATLFGAAVGCFLRGWHDSRRHPLGGQKCGLCHQHSADMEEAGLLDDDQVRETRHYDRKGGLTRYPGWQDSDRVRRRGSDG